MRLTRSLLLAAPLAVAPLALGLAACGDDDSSSSSGSYAIVSDAQVASGLATLQRDAAAVAAAPKADVDRAYDAVEQGWKSFEGTIKRNDKDAYLAFEDTLAALKKAAKADDQAAEAKALKDLGDQAGAYLAKHPG